MCNIVIYIINHYIYIHIYADLILKYPVNLLLTDEFVLGPTCKVFSIVTCSVYRHHLHNRLFAQFYVLWTQLQLNRVESPACSPLIKVPHG